MHTLYIVTSMIDFIYHRKTGDSFICAFVVKKERRLQAEECEIFLSNCSPVIKYQKKFTFSQRMRKKIVNPLYYYSRVKAVGVVPAIFERRFCAPLAGHSQQTSTSKPRSTDDFGDEASYVRLGEEAVEYNTRVDSVTGKRSFAMQFQTLQEKIKSWAGKRKGVY